MKNCKTAKIEKVIGQEVEFEKCADGSGWCRPVSENVYDESDTSDLKGSIANLHGAANFFKLINRQSRTQNDAPGSYRAEPWI